MKCLITILSLLMLTGCASQRHATTINRVNRDSTYASTRFLDSLLRVIMQRDSTYQRDSIHIYEKGDTVTKYVEHTKYKLVTRADTVYRDRIITDTVYINRTDTVEVERPVYIEKQIKWHQQAFIWVGKLCCLAAIFWAIFLYLKRKF